MDSRKPELSGKLSGNKRPRLCYYCRCYGHYIKDCKLRSIRREIEESMEWVPLMSTNRINPTIKTLKKQIRDLEEHIHPEKKWKRFSKWLCNDEKQRVKEIIKKLKVEQRLKNRREQIKQNENKQIVSRIVQQITTNVVNKYKINQIEKLNKEKAITTPSCQSTTTETNNNEMQYETVKSQVEKRKQLDIANKNQFDIGNKDSLDDFEKVEKLEQVLSGNLLSETTEEERNREIKQEYIQLKLEEQLQKFDKLNDRAIQTSQILPAIKNEVDTTPINTLKNKLKKLKKKLRKSQEPKENKELNNQLKIKEERQNELLEIINFSENPRLKNKYQIEYEQLNHEIAQLKLQISKEKQKQKEIIQHFGSKTNEEILAELNS